MQRRKRVGIASICLGFAVAIYQFAPSLAESISQSFGSLSSETPTELVLVDTNVVVIDTSISLVIDDSTSALMDPTNPISSESVESKTSESRVQRVPPSEVTAAQGMIVRIPQTVRVDPRAQGVFLPRIFAESANTLMVCVTSESLLLDLGSPGLADSLDTENLKVSGDRTGYLVISGDPELVVSVLNGASGMRAFRLAGGVANQSLSFALVDLSKPSMDDRFCAKAMVENRRTVTFVPLALEQRISDGKVRLGK